ncbi:MAG: insulinase family protein [Ignavibacteriae bacterium]|nr:insulinase family protein [Ignavibacteriota bacterium]
MKKFSAILILILFYNLSLMALGTLDSTKKPEPLANIEFKFPEYSQETLKNGLKLFYIEDKEQPTVSFSFMLQGGSLVDGEKAGLASIVAELLTKGTGKLTSRDIAEKIDGIGASLTASAGADVITISGYCLKKHLDTLLSLASQVLLNPAFPEDDFEKLIPRMIANLKQEKSTPGTLARNLARKIIYGDKHPYGIKPTEESLKEIVLSDVQNYYKTYFKPNSATVAVSGDLSKKDSKELIEKYFGKWQKGDVPKIKVPEPNSEPQGVYFISRPSSVQSTVIVATKAVPMTSGEYDVLELASSIIGSPFAGRLFRTLRETYSYTYSPFGRLSSNKYANIFACGAEVRNSVTDSSIKVINEQLTDLVSNPPVEDELYRVKNSEGGTYLMSFENPAFVLGLIQAADFYGISIERVKDYYENLMSYSNYQVRDIARKYMNPQNEYIFVVGSPEVKDKLEQFGKVFDYNMDLEPLTGEKGKFEDIGMNASELFGKFISALGGKENLDKIQTIIDSSKIKFEVMGRTIDGSGLQIQKAPNKKYMKFDLVFQKQEMWCDGTDAWSSAQGKAVKQEGKNQEDLVSDAVIFKDTKFIELGYKCDVLGKQKNYIMMKVVSPKLQESVLYFDPSTYLLMKVESTEDTPQGPVPSTIEYLDYISIEGVKFPKTLKSTNPMFSMTLENHYTINQPVEDIFFTPNK